MTKDDYLAMIVDVLDEICCDSTLSHQDKMAIVTENEQLLADVQERLKKSYRGYLQIRCALV